MKSEELQQIVLSKLRNGQFPTQISRDLNGVVSTRTIKRWSSLYNETGTIELSHPPGPSRTVRTKATVNKVKRWLNAKRKKSVRILARKLNVGRESVRVWVSREAANEMGGLRGISKFPGKIMVWLAVCASGVSKVVFLESGTVNQDKYITDVLPVARRFGNGQLGNDWWFQQDGARAHTAARTQNWCKENLPNFIEKDRWPANSPDLNPLDYSIWNEIVQGMNWDRVECKESLKAQIVLSVKKIRPQVVLDSCSSFYTRIRRLAVSDGRYLQK